MRRPGAGHLRRGRGGKLRFAGITPLSASVDPHLSPPGAVA